jgi:hypothetical protein
MQDLTTTEFIARCRLDPHRVKRLREESLTSEDWYIVKKGAGRPGYRYRESAVMKAIMLQVVGRSLPLAIPKFLRAKVTGPAKNPRYILCKIWLPNGETVKGAVLVNDRLKRNLTKGKALKVQCITKMEDNGKGGQTARRSYRHEKLCPK